MLIRPVSDIHNEFSVYRLPELPTDSKSVLVLAGDIALGAYTASTLEPFLDSVTDRFTDIVYTPGNHEYYKSSILRAEAKLRDVCKRYLNVHFLQAGSVRINDVKFICATLWTDFNMGNPLVMREAEDVMNDYRVIRTGPVSEPYRRPLRTIDTVGINSEHRAFIESELKEGHTNGEKMVVVTHHSMTMASCTGAYPAGPLDYAYYNTRMDGLILDYSPALCIHGHSHHVVDFMMGNTRIVNNARGYSKNSDSDEGLGHRPDLVIEV